MIVYESLFERCQRNVYGTELGTEHHAVTFCKTERLRASQMLMERNLERDITRIMTIF